MKKEYEELVREVILDDDWLHCNTCAVCSDTDSTACLVETWEDVEYLNGKFADALEKEGITVDRSVRDSAFDFLDLNYYFTDEYTTCDGCCRIVPRKETIEFTDEDWTSCFDCIRENSPSDYIDYLLQSPIDRANRVLTEEQLNSFGFHKLDGDFEAGLYGQWDEPKDIYNKVKTEDNDIIFHITSLNPFATYFDVYERRKD